MSGQDDETPQGGAPKRDYKVGRGKPPVEYQIKKGEVRNPAGRPRGSGAKNSAGSAGPGSNDTILRVANDSVSVQAGGKKKKMTLLEASVRSLAHNGIKGDTAASRNFARMVQQEEARETESKKKVLKFAMDLKNDFADLVALRRKRGLPLPSPTPHPDEIHINYATFEVTIGPVGDRSVEGGAEASSSALPRDGKTRRRQPVQQASAAMLAQALEHLRDHIRQALADERSATGLEAMTVEERRAAFADEIRKAVEKMDANDRASRGLPKSSLPCPPNISA